jgi:hypothetical protein
VPASRGHDRAAYVGTVLVDCEEKVMTRRVQHDSKRKRCNRAAWIRRHALVHHPGSVISNTLSWSELTLTGKSVTSTDTSGNDTDQHGVKLDGDVYESSTQYISSDVTSKTAGHQTHPSCRIGKPMGTIQNKYQRRIFPKDRN